MRIAHISDIHIRGISRHEEIRKVFEDFVDKVRSHNVDMIFVGGDIFHTKTTGITPEYIELMSWWLKLLGDAAETRLILGNHDGALTNLTRQDAVSPIVSAVNHPRIQVWKHSGLYSHTTSSDETIKFYVHSIFDEGGWDSSPRQEAGEEAMLVGCYHGPVAGSVSEAEWNIEGHVKVGDFTALGYDVVFLGDIHKYQTLGTKDFPNGKNMPWIAYPGSALQNTYAEDLEHGFIVWDLDAANKSVRDYAWVKLVNPCPFQTIDWAGSVKNTMKAAANLVSGGRVRVRSDVPVPAVDFQKLSDALVRQCSPLEIVPKIDDKNLQERIQGAVSGKGLKFGAASIFNALQKFYNDQRFAKSTWAGMEDLTAALYHANAHEEDLQRGNVWTLSCMNFSNLFAFGEDNSIKFDPLQGIVGIMGPNRTGKSSLVASLMYGLHNVSDRDSQKMHHMINKNASAGSAEVQFIVNGQRHYVFRKTQRVKNKLQETSLTTVKFVTDNEDFTGEQRNQTDRSIQRVVGGSDDFLMTAVSTQFNVMKFVNHDAPARKHFLSRVVGLDLIERMYADARRRLTALETESKFLLNSSPLETQAELVASNKAQLQELELKISAAEAELLKLNADCLSARAELDRIRSEDKTFNVKKLASELLALQSQMQELQASLTKKCSMDWVKEKESILSFVKGVDEEELKSKLKNAAEVRSSLTQERAKNAQLHKEILALKKETKKLQLVPCGDQFPSCHYIHDAVEANKKLPALQASLEQSDENVASYETELSTLGTLELEELESKVSKGRLRLKKIESEHKGVLSEISELEIAIHKKRGFIDACERNLEAEKIAEALFSAKRVRERVDAAKRALFQMESSRDVCRDSLEALKRDNAVSALKLDENSKKLSRAYDLKEQIKIHSLVSAGLSKRGVQNIFLGSLMPDLNANLKMLLAGVVDFDIELSTDEDKGGVEIRLIYPDGSTPLELGSGMEKTIASIAIRCVLHQISTLPKPDFMIIDEGFGTLDENQIEPCVRLLRALRSYFRFILVITHVPNIKEAFDGIIEVGKGQDGKSCIMQQQ